MRQTIFLLFLLFFLITNAQTVNIPDINFRNYLLTNTEVNTNNDNHIQVSEAVAFTGSLSFQFWFVNDLTGIQAFTNLTSLDCGDNNLTTIDLSQNIALQELYCYDNQLTSLDLSNNINLTTLDCRNNLLTTLDMSNNFNLTYLQCTYNQISNINLSQNLLLNTLRCFSNNLTSLDLSNNYNLVKLYASFNDLTFLDLSLNSSLTIMECNYNNLGALYMENGNNLNVTNFRALGNPNLECIQVDNEIYSTTNWTNIDATSTFSEDCTALSVLDFTNQNIKIFPNPVTSILQIDLKHEKVNYFLTTIKGQIISKGVINNNNIDVSILAEGIYFIKLINNKGEVFNKLIIKK